MRALLIVNPAAGGRTAAGLRPADLIPVLHAAGFTLDLVETTAGGPGSGELAARAVAGRYDACIVAGGDGTVAPAARALVGTETILGILPFGSFMNIAHGLGIPMEPRAAAAIIARAHVGRLDAGEANGTIFFETAGIGLDAELFGAARSAERQSWPHAVRRIRRWATAETHHLRVIVDGTAYEHRAMQLLVLNSPYYAWAIRLLRDVRMDDGVLDVAVFPRMGRLRLIGALYSVMRMRGLGVVPVRYRGKEIRIEATPPIAIHADGEIAGESPIEIRCRAAAVRVFVPAGR